MEKHNDTGIEPQPLQASKLVLDDLVAACNSLGKLDTNDDVYMKDRDCKSCLKEITRTLNADSPQHEVRIFLGQLNIIKSDLIPIINQYCDYNEGDQDLFKLIIKLCTNITSSVLLLFDDTPTEKEDIATYNLIIKGLQSYKDAFADDPKIWHVFNTYLRHADDEFLYERLLILIRNILHIPVDSSQELGIKGGNDAHVLCLQHMSKCGIFHTIVQVASETQKGREYCFHLIEIVYLILRGQNPQTVADSVEQTGLKRKLDEDDPGKKRLAELMARDKIEREVTNRKIGEVPRFKNSRFCVTNLTSLGSRPILTNTLVQTRDKISFDTKKTELRKAKNKKPLPSESNASAISDTNTSTSKVTYSLKMFSKMFVEKVYANYMQQIKYNLMQKKAADNDETYFLWSLQYFLPFTRHLRLDFNYVSETISTSTVHFIQIIIQDFQDKLKLEKKRSQYEKISSRLHLAVRAYKEILLSFQFIKPESELYKSIESTKKTIFVEIEYNSLILNLFKQYHSNKHCPEYLKDLVKANHVYLELIEEYHKDGDPMKATHFVATYCAPEIIASYSEVLREFKDNEKSINLYTLKFFQRIVYDCKSEVMLMQASLLKILLDIHDYHSSLPGYSEFVKLTKHVMTCFGEMIHKKRWMMQELLFWKNRHDVIEIENAVDPPPPTIPQEPVATSPRPDSKSESREENFEDNQIQSDELEQQIPNDSIEDLMAELGSDSEDAGSLMNDLDSPEKENQVGDKSNTDKDDDDDDEIVGNTSQASTRNRRLRLDSESDESHVESPKNSCKISDSESDFSSPPSVQSDGFIEKDEE